MTHPAPGKSHRKGISLFEITQMFPDEATAERWFEQVRWPTEKDRYCPKCGSRNTCVKENRKPLPFRCRDCRAFFSVRHKSVMERSKIPLHKWAIAVYLNATSLKGVSSMKLHRDLGITQKSAWHMAHRLKEAFSSEPGLFAGPVEVDETYFGGKRKNMSNAKRKELKDTGRGAVGKVAVVGAKDRATKKVKAKVVRLTDGKTLKGFVSDAAEADATIYTDDAAGYQGLTQPHGTVKHSLSEYVKGQIHTNGIESFWSMLKRAHMGTFHKLSEKHLHRYVTEFAGRHNMREADTINQMRAIVSGMVGKHLPYADLIAE